VVVLIACIPLNDVNRDGGQRLRENYSLKKVKVLAYSHPVQFNVYQDYFSEVPYFLTPLPDLPETLDYPVLDLEVSTSDRDCVVVEVFRFMFCHLLEKGFFIFR
jgi:hypothetical protein